MIPVPFLLVVHDHQPVGNFPEVVDAAVERAYAPLLELLLRRPGVKVGLHHSGCLLDSLEERHPDYLARLGELVARGQVELLTGPDREPILPVVSSVDRVAQIRRLTARLAGRFGVRPSGAWIPERVWAPDLPHDLSAAGVRWTLLDDFAFRLAGLDDGGGGAVWTTGDADPALRVVPISRALRYAIPFAAPGEAAEAVLAEGLRRPGGFAVLGDDGEKFGVWPDTHARVWRDGWLDAFLDGLEGLGERIRFVLPGEAVLGADPAGRVELPESSYPEMGEWTLPPLRQRRLHRLRAELPPDDAALLGGGVWRNFLVRYPESRHLLRRVEDQLARARRLGGEAGDEARGLLYSAQCNCAYWHGVFGGFYLPHLRHALHRHLLRAEAILDAAEGIAGARTRTLDLDGDGEEEVLLVDDRFTLVVAPAAGGVLREIGAKDPAAPLGSVAPRREEAYHEHLPGALLPGENPPDGARSIHDVYRAKEPGLPDRWRIDTRRRDSLEDRFLLPGITGEEVDRGRARELGDFLDAAYDVGTERDADGTTVHLAREGAVWRDGEPRRVRVEKEIRLTPEGVEARLTVALLEGEALHAIYAPGWNLTLGEGPDADRPVGGGGDPERFALGAPSGLRLELRRHPGGEWLHHPVETVTLSEEGFEAVHQGVWVAPAVELRLAPGESVTLRLSLQLAPAHDAAAAGPV